MTGEITTNEMTGGEALARMLQAHNGGAMFGMGGFQLLPFYDAARRLGLPHHLINDERAAVFIADAYAKVSGRVGLCDATLGPGATNLVTGLVEALNAGSPLVVIVGDSHRDHSWKNMTQESRQLEILRPACKEVIRVEAVNYDFYHDVTAEQLDKLIAGLAAGKSPDEIAAVKKVNE